MSRPRLHVFVCQNLRPGGDGGRPSCAGRGSHELLVALRTAIGQDEALASTVAVTPTACLGPCFLGPTVVVYPDAVWYGGVTVADAATLVEEHLRQGRPLERLRVDTRWDQETEDPDPGQS